MSGKILCIFGILFGGLFLQGAYEVRNFGQAGAPVSRILKKGVPLAAAEKPDMVLLMAGTSDFVNSRLLPSAERYEQTMRQMVAEFSRRGIRTLLCTLPYCHEDLVYRRHAPAKYGKQSPNQRIRQANECLQRIASEQNLLFYDFAAVASGYGYEGAGSLIRNPENGGGKDGIRLTEKGAGVFAEGAAALVRRAVPSGKIICLGDDQVHGTGSACAGKDSGGNIPGYLNFYLNPPKLRVGFLSEEFRYGKAWRKYGLYEFLKERDILGNAENSMSWIFGRQSEEEIFRHLSRYHAVVISLNRGYLHADYEKTTIPYRNAVRRFLRQGGGVLLIPQNGEYIQDRRIEIFNLMFGEYGVKMLREGINDPEHQFFFRNHPFLPAGEKCTPGYLNFFVTENIRRSPVTEKVRCLFFPQWGCGGMWGTMALQLNPLWKTAVAGEQSARSYLFDSSESKNRLFRNEGSIRQEPVLAATRSYEKGRMGIISCNLMHLTINAKALDWPAVCEENGDGVRRSDGRQLLLNFLQYVGEPARSNPLLGSWQEPDEKKEEKQMRQPWNFEKIKFPEAVSKTCRGLIGLHTELSDGKGTVREYVAMARNAGYQFVVFTEALEKLTAEEFALLKQECRRLSSDHFYACPGIEFTDGVGLRWTFWGEAVLYPSADVLSADRKAVEWWGLYATLCDRRPSAVLNYDRLHQLGSPANLWWYFRIPAKVVRRGRVVSRPLQEYLFALDDIRKVGVFVYNGIYSPDKILREGRIGGSNCVPGGMENVRQWLNSKNMFHSEKGYFSEGPEIQLWSGINHSHSSDYNSRRGWQRVRLKFQVVSPAGIKEVLVLDGTRGVFRRFAGRGAKAFTREFSAVHDRVHSLVLKVIDRQNRTAVSSELRLENTLYAVTRCSDNLNLLGYSTLYAHPDQHQLSSMRNFEDIISSRYGQTHDRIGIAGIDSAGAFVFSPAAFLNFNFFTREGTQLGGSNQLDEWNAVNQKYPLNSSEISILSSDSSKRVNTRKRHKPGRRLGYRNASFFAVDKEQPIADIRHTSYLLRSRIRPSMRYVCPWLADGDYDGGVMCHDLEFHLRKDVVLSGTLPVQLAFMVPGSSHFSARNGYWNRLCAMTPEGLLDLPLEKVEYGSLTNGGGLTVLSRQSPRRVVLVPYSETPGIDFHFMTEKGCRVILGLGKNGMPLKKGSCIRIRLLVVALVNQPADRWNPKNIAELYHLYGQNASGWTVRNGKILDRKFFVSLQAEKGEILMKSAPQAEICDQPVRISGIEDNGCAAYFDRKSSKGGFVFVPVVNRQMFFQISAEKGVDCWAGNVFLADRKELKLNLISIPGTDGQEFHLEIHNPGYQAAEAEIRSPEHVPYFGGMHFRVKIPPGDSVRRRLPVLSSVIR